MPIKIVKPTRGSKRSGNVAKFGSRKTDFAKAGMKTPKQTIAKTRMKKARGGRA